MADQQHMRNQQQLTALAQAEPLPGDDKDSKAFKLMKHCFEAWGKSIYVLSVNAYL